MFVVVFACLTYIACVLSTGAYTQGIILAPYDGASCGTPSIQHRERRLVGGHEAEPGSWPWQVMLVRDGVVACGGTLLNDKLILSAAHCFSNSFDDSPTVWQVYVGKHHVPTVDQSEQQHSLRRIVLHPEFDNVTLKNDLALVELEESVELNDFVSPVCLPENSASVGEYCFVTGWGDTRGTGDASVLNQISVPILHDYWCSRADWYGAQFYRGVSFCAGFKSGARDACSGDSGGPLSCEVDGKWFVRGVTSWGYDCAQPNHPGIYVDVFVYRTWIRDTAALLGYRLA